MKTVLMSPDEKSLADRWMEAALSDTPQDAAKGLECELELTGYPESPAIEWLVCLRNTSTVRDSRPAAKVFLKQA